MAEVKVDLTAEAAQGWEAALAVRDQQFGPSVEDELHANWPRRTGTSERAWSYTPGLLANNVDYTEYIRTRDGLATETVLQPILTEAAARPWME